MFYLGCSTLHLLGKHWVDIYQTGKPRIWFMSFEYGKDYSAAIAFVRRLNWEAGLTHRATCMTCEQTITLNKQLEWSDFDGNLGCGDFLCHRPRMGTVTTTGGN